MEIVDVKILVNSTRDSMVREIVFYSSRGYQLFGTVQLSMGGDRGNSKNFCATMVKYKESEK